MAPFRHKKMREEAVSPVIAVILMVAITVVLAAVVYTWVSGFGTNQGGFARSLSIVSDGPAANSNASFTVSSASTDLSWSELELRLDGKPLNYANLTSGTPGQNRWCVWNGNGWSPMGSAIFLPYRSGRLPGYCDASPQGFVGAGARLMVQNGSLTGLKLTVVDTKANAALVSLTVR